MGSPARIASVAVEDRDAAAGHHDAHRLGERDLGLRYVAERRMEHDGLERSLGERKLPPVCRLEAEGGHALRELTRLRDEDGRRIHPDRRGHAGPTRDEPTDRAGATAHLEHASSARQRRIREVRREHRLELRIRGAHLERSRQRFEERGRRFRDAGIEVGHGGNVITVAW
jgi:hypothetical protein